MDAARIPLSFYKAKPPGDPIITPGVDLNSGPVNFISHSISLAIMIGSGMHTLPYQNQ